MITTTINIVIRMIIIRDSTGPEAEYSPPPPLYPQHASESLDSFSITGMQHGLADSIGAVAQRRSSRCPLATPGE